MRKSKLTRALVLVIVTVAAFALCVPTIAADLYKKNVEIWSGMNLVVNGNKVIPTDNNGAVVEVFSLDGTTYVPVRAIAYALGLSKDQVSYDGTTKTVYIGKNPNEVQTLDSVCPPYQTVGAVYRSNTDEHPDSVNVFGNTYVNATCYGGSDTAYTLYNLNGQYNSFTYKIGHVDGAGMIDATLEIYLDGELATTRELKADGIPVEGTIALNGAIQMKIAVNYHHSSWGTPFYDWAMVETSIE